MPGSGVQAVCQISGRPAHRVRFGSLAFVGAHVAGWAPLLDAAVAEDRGLAGGRGGGEGGGDARCTGATSFLSASPLVDDAGSTGGGAFDGRSPRVGGGSGSVVGGGCGAAAVAMFCFEDAVLPGVAEAVDQLQRGTWLLPRGGGGGGLRTAAAAAGWPTIAAEKSVVMLTGAGQGTAGQAGGTFGVLSSRCYRAMVYRV